VVSATRMCLSLNKPPPPPPPPSTPPPPPSSQDVIRRYKDAHPDNWELFPQKVAFQLNDTHPTIAVPELMRLLMDENKLGWTKSWDLATKVGGGVRRRRQGPWSRHHIPTFPQQAHIPQQATFPQQAAGPLEPASHTLGQPMVAAGGCLHVSLCCCCASPCRCPCLPGQAIPCKHP
jgi:hypothetical protein